ncbi:SEN1 N terminal-domain-containing protein [Limtongia smithiae]|uniref:SEN1 N terminal-domain-containing protein n=1 Tax=Limtongia smithiae TaxID=1125753 RepID=UPI0034CDF6CB
MLSEVPPANAAGNDQLARVAALIEESKKSDDPALQEQALQESISYLMGLPKSVHLFCSNSRRPIAIAALQIFAFDSTPELEWLKTTLGKQLQDCFLCVKAYHKAKGPMKAEMLEQGIDKSDVDVFLTVLDAWDTERLVESLTPSAEKCNEAMKENPNKPVPGTLISASFNALYECLYAPALIAHSAALRSVFRSVFMGAQAGGRFLRLSKEIVPAMIAFLFIPGVPEFTRWAEKSMSLVKTKVTSEEFDSCVQTAYCDAVIQYVGQQGKTAKDVLHFWSAMKRILAVLSKPVMLRSCVTSVSGSGDSNGGENIVLIAWRDLQISPQIYPILLPVFNILVTTLGTDMWPVSAPFLPSSLTDIVFSDNNIGFEVCLKEAARDRLKIAELMDWIWPYLNSISGSVKLKICEILASKFMRRYQTPAVFGVDNVQLREQCVLVGLRALEALLNFNDTTAIGRIMRREARKVVEAYAQLIIDGVTNPSVEVQILAKRVLAACIVTDCVSVAEESEIMTSEILSAATMKSRDITSDVLAAAANEASRAMVPSGADTVAAYFGEHLWTLLRRRFPEDDIVFAKSFILSLGKTKLYLAESIDNMRISNEAAGGSSANSANVRLVACKVKKFGPANQIINKTLAAVANILQQISDFSAAKLNDKKFLDQATMEVLLSFALSSHTLLSQSSLEVVKQMNNSSDRLESLRSLFKIAPTDLLNAYVAVINNNGCTQVVTGLGTIPKLVRMTMDIADLLFNPREGYIAAHNSIIPDESVQAAGKAFWNTVWAALVHIFKRTLTWSRVYSKDLMVEYMRDVLDLSAVLFQNLQLLGQAVTCKDPTSEDAVAAAHNLRELLTAIMAPLNNMCMWLRLSDLALLQVCVQLVCDALTQFNEANITLAPEVFKKLENLAHNRETHHSNLTDTQCYDIVAALTPFDVDGVLTRKSYDSEDSVSFVSESNVKKVARQGGIDRWVEKGYSSDSSIQLKPRSLRDLDSDEVSIDEEFAKTERARKIEQTYSKLKLEEKERPPASKSSLLTSMRHELRHDRQRKTAPVVDPTAGVIHPARPAGFRVTETVGAGPLSRIAASRTSASTSPGLGDDTSSEGGSDDDDIDSLFSLAKTHRPSLKVHAPIAPTPLRVSAAVSGLRRHAYASSSSSSLNDKERAERNMRARLRVNLDPLYQRILRWDYHNEGDLPSDEIGSDLSTYRVVPDKFNSPVEYKDVFEPLLMLECVQGIAKNKLERYDKPFRVSVTNRAVCDDYIEIYATIDSKSLINAKIGEMDILVLTFIPGEQEFAMSATSPIKDMPAKWPDKTYPNCLAKVKEVKRTLQKETSDVLMRCLPNSEMSRHLIPKTELNALRVMSTTTIEREYSSLQGLPYYDLSDQILQARPAHAIRADAVKVRKTQAAYNVNAPQAGAIIAAIESPGFTLIQGPPGTGKTKTILGIIGATLTATKSRGVAIQVPGQRSAAPINLHQQQQQQMSETRRILVCAPSNAAVDEIVLRLKAGIRSSTGEEYRPKIVRLGRSDNINPAVRELTLEEQVDSEVAKFEAESSKKNGGVDRLTLREQLNKVVAERNEVDTRMAATENPGERDELRSRRDMLNAKKAALGQQLDDARDKHSMQVRTNEIERRNIQSRILTSAEVICATLSGAGHDLLATLGMVFETVIIDEAAQCVELSALIPLKYGCTRCAMVGDPNQLPPTVLSQTASKYRYEQSLFVRIQKNNPSAVNLLSIQYRMHPQISLFPSAQFYDSKLIDGDGMVARTMAEWHSGSEIFGPYRFFNVQSKEQISKTHSYYNKAEAHCALQIYQSLLAKYPDINFEGRIGIVTPYKQQLHELKTTFRTTLGQVGMHGLDFNTIDGFQGQEKDIIILSCVRAQNGGSSRGVGFLADVRRMNVALTRAKSSLWIIGNMESLVASEVWRKLIEDAKRRGLVSYFDGKKIVNEPQAGTKTTGSGEKGKGEKKRPRVSVEGEGNKEHVKRVHGISG